MEITKEWITEIVQTIERDETEQREGNFLCCKKLEDEDTAEQGEIRTAFQLYMTGGTSNKCLEAVMKWKDDLISAETWESIRGQILEDEEEYMKANRRDVV